MIKLTNEQLQAKVNFINQYLDQNSNAATASKMDANANVTQKNIVTLRGELYKDFEIQINRYMMYQEITQLFGEELAKEYIRQLEQHELYRHDETKNLYPYCASIDLFPMVTNGMSLLGGEAKAPKHLESFCGSFINTVLAVSGQLAGAVSTVQWLVYFHYFAKKDYGCDYIQTHRQDIIDKFQHVVYTLNQPHTARDGQAAFWNISFVDSNYFYGLFGDMVYPDFSKPTWSEFKELQKLFLIWFREEREKELLTFPVINGSLLTDKKKILDNETLKFCCDELSNGNSFFVYMSDSVDTLSSCCRLSSKVENLNEFSFTLGAGGIKTGSIGVITINYNRMIQDGRKIEDELPKIHKYHVAYRNIIKRMIGAGMLPIYDVGLIDLDSQYSTIGINGMVEAAEYLGHEISAFSEPYKDFLKSELQKIYNLNKIANKEYGCKFNTEFVPAENLGVKNCDWDRKDGYVIPADRICYNSYFYRPEDDMNIIDKFILHGEDIIQYLDGGSALHLNLKEHLDSEQYEKLFHIACTQGCNYWTVNIRRTYCEACGYNDPHTRTECIKCGSNDISYITRIIGYHKKIKNFHEKRQVEANKRHYHE